MRPSKHEFTQLLRAASAGDEDAKEQLWSLMYEELRRVARGQMKDERRDHTLSTTGLVHEAYLRLIDQEQVKVKDRAHFRKVAARVMRQILIDYARRRNAQRRGGGQPNLPFDEDIHKADEQVEVLLTLDEMLSRLEQFNDRLSKVVELRYFGGFTREETAEALDVSVRTVERDWEKARGWLYQQMYGGGE